MATAILTKTKSSQKDYMNDRVTSPKERAFNIIIFIVLFLFAITMVFPLIYMVATSFMTKNQILSGTLTIIPDPILIGKYSEVMKKGQFISGIFNTIKVEIPVLLIGGFTSSLAAFAFAKMEFRGKNALFLALLATIMIPFAVVMIPQYVLFTKLHWTNSLAPLIIPGCFGNVSMIFFLRQNLQHSFRSYGCSQDRRMQLLRYLLEDLPSTYEGCSWYTAHALVHGNMERLPCSHDLP